MYRQKLAKSLYMDFPCEVMSLNNEKKEPNRCELSGSCDTNVVPNLHHNSTTLVPNCQSLEHELTEKWNKKKSASEPLVLSFLRLGLDKRAERCADCGTLLEFTPVMAAGGESPQGLPPAGTQQPTKWHLYKANFCRDRLCPMCSWRRSYKIFGQVSQIMDLIAKDYDFLFLTLTVPNVTASELSNKLDELQKGWYKLSNYKRVKSVLKGFFKALEITYNQVSDTYHPHYHIVLAVPKCYLSSRGYIQRDEWLRLWQRAMKDETITQVDIRRAKGKVKGSEISVEGAAASKALASAIAEIAKYAVKSSDYIFKDDELTDRVVGCLADVLTNRRLCAFGGCFAEAHKQLQLDDAEDGDLIHLDGEIRADLAMQIYRFEWSCGAYKLKEIVTKTRKSE